MAKTDTASAVVMVTRCALVPQWPDILLLALASISGTFFI